MSDDEDKKYKKDRPGLFDFNYTAYPNERVEHQVKHKFSKWEKKVNKAFKPYKHYLKDQLNPQNVRDFEDTEARVSAANNALREKLAAQTNDIKAAVTGELNGLGHNTDSGVTGDYDKDAAISANLFNKEANFEKTNVHDQRVMDMARGMDYNILAKAYRQDLRNTPPDPMMGKPAGSGFAPFMGGGWGMGGGSGFGFTPYASYTQPNRSQGTQDALKSLLGLPSQLPVARIPSALSGSKDNPLGHLLGDWGSRMSGMFQAYSDHYGGNKKSSSSKKRSSSGGHVSKKNRKKGRTDINTGKSWEPRGDGGKTYSGIGATK